MFGRRKRNEGEEEEIEKVERRRKRRIKGEEKGIEELAEEIPKELGVQMAIRWPLLHIKIKNVKECLGDINPESLWDRYKLAKVYFSPYSIRTPEVERKLRAMDELMRTIAMLEEIINNEDVDEFLREEAQRLLERRKKEVDTMILELYRLTFTPDEFKEMNRPILKGAGGGYVGSPESIFSFGGESLRFGGEEEE